MLGPRSCMTSGKVRPFKKFKVKNLGKVNRRHGWQGSEMMQDGFGTSFMDGCFEHF